MDEPLAQIAALAIAGNYWLKGGDLGRFWPDSRVFNFCKLVKFITLTGEAPRWHEHPYTDDYPSWLAKQKSEGVLGFRLVHIPVNKPLISDRHSAGFVGGGGPKLVEAVHAKTMDGWEAGWTVRDQKDPDRKIWQVKYARIGEGLERRDIVPNNLTCMVQTLQDALVDIAVFARRHDQSKDWAETFDQATTVLKSKTPLDSSYSLKGSEAMLPDLRAQQLLAASDIGHVFGAMGSWNDLGFEGEAQQEYEKLSDRLFQVVIESITTAVNSTFDAP